MTAATTPPPAAAGGQPAVQPPQPGAAAASSGLGGAVLLVATRVGLWLGVQLGLAGLLLVVGEAATGGEALDAAAGWWMVYGALVDLGTLGVIFWLLRRDHRAYRSLLGPPATAWQVALGRWGCLGPACRRWSSAASSPPPSTARTPSRRCSRWSTCPLGEHPQRAGSAAAGRAGRADRLPGRGPAAAGGALGPALARRRHRGGGVGRRARLVPAAARRWWRPGPGVRRLPGGLGAALLGDLDRRLLRAGAATAYEQFLAGISRAARTFPSYLGIEIFRPAPGAGDEYRTVYRFDSAAHLHAWLDSPQRAAWLARAEPHAAGPMRTQVLVGLESWFTLPTQPGAPPPPRYKMAILTWATIFPLITLVAFATAPLLLVADAQFLTFGCGADSRLVVTSSTTGTREQATKASWRVDDLAGEVAWLRSRGVQVQDLPELGTVDGIADLGFALAAWFVDPHHHWIGLLQLK